VYNAFPGRSVHNRFAFQKWQKRSMSINTRTAVESGLRKLLLHTKRNIHTKTKARVVRYPGFAVATP
jgi:hypothetical protein